MESNKSIGEILSYLQYHLKAPKDNKNTFGNYNYRNADNILTAFKKTAMEAGLTVSITIQTQLIPLQNNIFIEAIATLFNNTTKEQISANAFALHPFNQKGMSESQMTGSAITYAKKYALCNLFAIDDSSEDPDTSFNSLLNSVQSATDIETLNAIKAQSEKCNLKPNEKTVITKAIQDKINKNTQTIPTKIKNADNPNELNIIYKNEIANNAFLSESQKKELVELCSQKKQSFIVESADDHDD